MIVGNTCLEWSTANQSEKEINSCLYIIRKKKFNRLVQKETEKAKRVEKEEERRNKSDSI